MTDDEKLAAFFADDAPPARDAAFRLAVLERLERRRVRLQLAAWTALCLAATAAVWVLAPRLEAFTTAIPLVTTLLVSAGLVAWFAGLFGPPKIRA